MNEVWLRVAFVAGAALIVAIVVASSRRRPDVGVEVPSTEMSPGVYLFTSGTCADCVIAKERLVEQLGPDGFHEIEWEKDPDVFARIGIDVVPCTVVVSEDGSSVRYPGMPDKAFERFNP